MDRGEAGAVAMVLVAGAALGIISSAFDQGLGGPLAPWISQVVSRPWFWLATGWYLVWRGQHQAILSVIHGLVFYVTAGFSYYLADYFSGEYQSLPNGFSYAFGDAVSFVKYAVPAGVLVGLLVATARVDGWPGLIARLVVPMMVLGYVVIWQFLLHWWKYPPEPSNYVDPIVALGSVAVMVRLVIRHLQAHRQTV